MYAEKVCSEVLYLFVTSAVADLLIIVVSGNAVFFFNGLYIFAQSLPSLVLQYHFAEFVERYHTL